MAHQTLSLIPVIAISPLQLYLPLWESIESEGNEEYMYVEGRVLTSSDELVLGVAIKTWETDDNGESNIQFLPFLLCWRVNRTAYILPPTRGYYGTQHTDHPTSDCRGRLRTEEQGRYGNHAIVPIAYLTAGNVRFIILYAILRHFGTHFVYWYSSATQILTKNRLP